MEKLQLFCLPHAGGSKSIYQNWVNTALLEVTPVEYSGHASRFNEPLFYSFGESVNDLASIIQKNIHGKYVIFGHSLGALLTFYVTVQFRQQEIKMPEAIILSSAVPCSDSSRVVHKDEAMQQVGELGHIPPIFFTDAELYDLYSEIIYHDILLNQECISLLSRQSVNVPLLVLYGDSDKSIDKNKAELWRNYTTDRCEFFACKGDHFYLFEPEFNIYDWVERAVTMKRVFAV